MQITLLAIGSRGDVQPMIALSAGFKQAGYDVQLGAPANFQTAIEERGINYFCITPDFTQVMGSETGLRMNTAGENALLYLDCMVKIAQTFLDQLKAEAWKACQGTDAIVFNPFSQIGHLIGKKLNIPTWSTWIYPIGRTRYFPLVGTPTWLSLGKAYNRSTYFIYELIGKYYFQSLFEDWRQWLNLKPMPFMGYFEELFRDQVPLLYGYSEHVIPKPPDWPAWYSVTGYWFLDHHSSWQPPADLVEFLADGPPPIYIGFGSMRDGDADRLAQIMIETIRLSGRRAILTKGWGGLDPKDISDEGIFFIDNVPHDWLFPKMAAVVHHGGAGTTAAGLRAGVPAIIVPFSGDQPYWAKQMYSIGVSTKPIPYAKISAQTLAEAIRTATTDQLMQEKTAILGQNIRAEDGVARAIEAFECSLTTR